MLELVRHIYRVLRSSDGRFRIAYELVRNIPEEFGVILRNRVLKKRIGKMGKGVKVYEGTRFRNVEKVYLGNDIRIGVDNFIQAGGGLEIGDYTILGPRVKIWTQNHTIERANIPIQKQGYEYKKVVIGEDVWIGADAFIMPGTILGDGVVVSAGAVVGAKTIPDYKILAGNPARIIGSRQAAGEGDRGDDKVVK